MGNKRPKPNAVVIKTENSRISAKLKAFVENYPLGIIITNGCWEAYDISGGDLGEFLGRDTRLDKLLEKLYDNKNENRQE
jgi:hypothetical protein